MPRRPTNPAPKKRKSAPDWAPKFLRKLAAGTSIKAAAKHAGVNRDTVYARRDADPDFAAALKSALEDACDALEDVARARAKRQSDTLLIFLLKSHRPTVYGDKLEVSGGVRLEVVEEVVDADAAADGAAAPGPGGVPPQ